MEVITKSNGNLKVITGGYAYNDKSVYASGDLRLRCSQKGKFKGCLGTITTDPGLTTVLLSTAHSHGPDPKWAKGQLIREKLKSIAACSRGKPNQIVTDLLSKEEDVDVIVATGSKDSLRQVAKRKQRDDTPKNPATIADIPNPFPEEYRSNLIYDNEKTNGRIIMFASEDGLELLGSSDIWYMDGTHSTCPSQFEQLFIIRVPLGNTCVSAVYAYLPSKKEDDYTAMLNALKDVCNDRDILAEPTIVVADYEIGIHNAVRDAFEDESNGRSPSIQGCFYHLTQSTWREVQAVGLQSAYNESVEVREFCGKLDSLAFLPISDVKEGINVLYGEIPEQPEYPERVEKLRCLVEYFDRVYVNGTFKSVNPKKKANTTQDTIRHLRLRRVPPRYPPAVWNVHNATIEGRDRTNNQCESFNAAFKHLVGSANPSLWTVSMCISEDAQMVCADIRRELLGKLPKKRAKKGTRAHQQTLKRLCNQYRAQETSLRDFLNEMGKSIRIAKKKRSLRK